MKSEILFVIFIVVVSFSFEYEYFKSTTYNWENLIEKRSLTGKQRNILEGKTANLEYIEIHASSFLPKSRRTPVKHIHPEHEELIIVTEGIVDATLNGKKISVPAGGILLVCQGDEHTVVNGTDDQTTYFIFRWKARNPIPREKSNDQSAFFMPFETGKITTNQQAIKSIAQRSTSQLNELTIIETTLNQGKSGKNIADFNSDEFVLILDGQVSCTLNSQPHILGENSFLYRKASDQTKLVNTEIIPCRYYSVKIR